MKIITISREFGAGGRELGKRLAEELGIHCYDHEIIELIAKEHGFDERYVANISEKCIAAAYPTPIGHRIAMPPVQIMDQGFQVAAAQQQIIENFAKQGDCVIVGRCADVILKDYHPLNLFVYADMDAKVERCMKRAPEGEHLTRSKPAPDIFLLAAQKLGTEPAKTMVLEDSYNGVRAGAAGGFVTVMVPDLSPATDEMRRIYTCECASLHEVRRKLEGGEL